MPSIHNLTRTMTAIALVSGLLGNVAAFAQSATDGGTDASTGVTTGATAGTTSGTSTGTASGTSAGTTATSAPNFEALSPGGQKIARALFDAQKLSEPVPSETTSDTSVPTAGTSGSSNFAEGQPATLDQIAKAKTDGSGWGEVFKEMQAAGLVMEKNLGQVVSGAKRAERVGGTAVDSGDESVATASGSAESSGSVESTSAAGASSTKGAYNGGGGKVYVTLANGQTVQVGRGHGGSVRAAAGDGNWSKNKGTITNAAGGGKVSGAGKNFGETARSSHGAGIVSGSGGAVVGSTNVKVHTANGVANGHAGSASAGISNGAGAGGGAAAGAQAGIVNAGGSGGNGHAFGHGKK